MTTAAVSVPGRRGTSPWLVAPVVGLAAFMEVLDISIANVSLRHIAGSLAASQEEATWVLTSYLVANAIVLPISGWMSQMIGRKRFFLISIIIFTASSFMCGVAPSLGTLIFFRILQGLGGGGLQPVAQAIIADAFPASKRGMGFAVYGIAVVVAPALGPTLGGWITDNMSWHWIFLINVPVGVVLVFLVTALIHDSAAYRAKRKATLRDGFTIDYIGFGLLALGLGSLQMMLDKGQQDDWFDSNFIVAMAAMSIVCLTVLVVWELYHKHPIIDLRLFKYRNFAVANLLMFMLGFTLLASTVLIPQFVQILLGYTATQAGLVISPGGFVIILMMPLAGLLSGRIAARWQITFGLVVVAASMFLFSDLSLQVNFNTIVLFRIVQTVGLAFMFIPISNVSYVGIPEDKTDQVSAFTNLARNIGGSVGISMVTTMLARGSQTHQNHLVAHTTPYDPAYNTLLNQLGQRFHELGAGAVHAGEQAQSLVYSLVQQQASLLAYLDDFRLLGYIFIALIPFVFLLKNDIGADIPEHGGH